MRLTTTTNVSVDGVMQGLGGPDEDRSGGFVRGGWAIPLLDTEAGDYLNQVYGGADAFLFGRRTYEIFAGYWGAMTDPSVNPIAAALNDRPKYVASTSLTDPQWAGTTVLHGHLATAIGDLKGQRDGELVVPGSGVLVRWLLANDLVDQLDLVTYPVVVGQGTRLFPDSGPDLALELVNSRTTSRGITIQTYRPFGRPEYATSSVGPDQLGKGQCQRASLCRASQNSRYFT
ncbi:dihydrofolate reductase family protein [Arthrobacter rhizosphaerae]|uniref:dihydrofolate reductase family protein n=1 Tax=Arthrobacter rhizosphaerae TaxID=2855490 RepID=UPI001FF59780|nr:dihydrofolate reductase family protein [Arthrobacter rhizosphaerae]